MAPGSTNSDQFTYIRQTWAKTSLLTETSTRTVSQASERSSPLSTEIQAVYTKGERDLTKKTQNEPVLLQV